MYSGFCCTTGKVELIGRLRAAGCWGYTCHVAYWICAERMAHDSQPKLSVDDAKVVLQKVLDAYSTPENKTRMEEVKDAAGKDMMKVMQYVFPVAAQIQMEVIQKYGFSPDGEGAIKFAQLIRHYESTDSTISELSSQLKSIFLPPLPSSSPLQNQASAAATSS